MNPRIGIPTMYRGVRMRSRTEARWAAMFDRLGWRWSYEPFDLNGYIPDFVITLGTGDLICEVKASDEDFAEAELKLDCSSWEGNALIVGHDMDRFVVGRLRQFDGVQQAWGTARFFWCISCQRHSILQEEGSWKCPQCGDGYGNEHVGEFDANELWIASSNAVQWKGVGS